MILGLDLEPDDGAAASQQRKEANVTRVTSRRLILFSESNGRTAGASMPAPWRRSTTLSIESY